MIKNKIVIYKQLYINGKKFRIRKFRGKNNDLLYIVSMLNKFRYIGTYKNPRDAINAIKEFASIFN